MKGGIFVTDIAADLHKLIELRQAFLSQLYPTDTLVEVSSLVQPGPRIKIEVIAVAR